MCYLRHHSDTIRKIGAGSKGAGTDVLKLDTSRPITVWGKWGSQRTSGVETGSPESSELNPTHLWWMKMDEGAEKPLGLVHTLQL